MWMHCSLVKDNITIQTLTKYISWLSIFIVLKIWHCAVEFEQFNKTTRICSPHSMCDIVPSWSIMFCLQDAKNCLPIVDSVRQCFSEALFTHNLYSFLHYNSFPWQLAINLGHSVLVAGFKTYWGAHQHRLH